jgi:glycosyltransferase involved in cell wall biosynthesis
MLSPHVSVILPVHNGVAHLREAVQSIRDQTFSDFELLIIDDASTDCTTQLIAQLSKEDKRIRTLRHHTQMGVTASLNEGFTNTQSPFIARMDADDRCSPHRLARQLMFMRQHPHLGLCGSWIRCFGAVRPYTLTYPCGPETIRAYLLFGNPFPHPSILFRRESLDRHNLRYAPSVTVAQDLEFWSRCVDLFPTDNLPETLVEYRLHNASVSTTRTTESHLTAVAIVKKQLAKLFIELDEDDFSFHFNIARGGVMGGKEKLRRVHNWLNHLIARNNAISAYSKEGFIRACGFVWFRACLNASLQGRWVWSAYTRSSLRRTHNPIAQERLAFAYFIFRGYMASCMARKQS